MHGTRNNTQTFSLADPSATVSAAARRITEAGLFPCLALLVLVLILISGRV